jgi:hypothetical protein
LVVEQREDGSLAVDLQGRFRQVMFARLDAAGKLSVDHTVPLELLLGVGGPAPRCSEVDSAAAAAGGDDARR